MQSKGLKKPHQGLNVGWPANAIRSPYSDLNDEEVDMCHLPVKPLSERDIDNLEWALNFMKNYEKKHGKT